MTYKKSEIKKQYTTTLDKAKLVDLLVQHKTIECIGMQGSGKTTLMHWLHDTHGVSIIVPDHRWRSLWKWHALRFCSTHPSLTLWWSATALIESLRVKKPRMFVHKIHMLLVLVARFSYLHSLHPRQVRVLDEGFLQGILSLYEHSISEKKMQRILQRVPVSDCVVYLDTSFTSGSFDKVSNRRSSFGCVYVRHWKIVFSNNLQTLATVLTEQKTPSFMKVDKPNLNNQY